MTGNHLALVGVLLSLAVFGCDATGPTPPEELLLRGSASAVAADGLQVECAIEAVVKSVRPGKDGWTADGIGEVARHTDPGGNRKFSFEAVVGGPVVLRPTGDDGVRLRFVGDQPDDAKAFWRSLEVLDGAETGPFRYEGTWSCAPLEVDEEGFTDTEGVATGRWELAPR